MANYEFHNNGDGTFRCQNCGENVPFTEESRTFTGAEIITVCPTCYDEIEMKNNMIELNELREKSDKKEEVFRYFKFIDVHKEVKKYDNGEEETIIVEIGIGCNEVNHAMTIATVYLVDDAVVYAEHNHTQKLGKCTCSERELHFHKIFEYVGGFILTSSL